MSKRFWHIPNTGAWFWPGMAFGGRHRFFEAGELRLAILSLLSEGPKHGYQLMKEMETRSGGFYKASAGSVYPTLQQLEDEGLVEAELIAGRRTYRLTDAGRQELDKDPEGVRRIWERAGQCEDWGQFMAPESFAVLGSLVEVMKAGMRAAGRLRDQPAGPERIREIADRARRELEQL